jgi:hypothetical protein
VIELIPNQPDNVVALAAKGKVTGSDYETVIIPAVEAALVDNDKIRLLYYCGPEFTSFDAAAAWDDARVGLMHLTHFEKVAVVTDHDWIKDSVKVFGFMMPGQVKVFSNAQLADAQKWVAQ